ncbi:MAG: S1 RNA-binding domain-containing protein [Candidatus Wildermuthbacteria bacterium]|nr:S1 RNA-binding domain-containing protein [Candidatus Wildermuthbacteria bacterium]
MKTILEKENLMKAARVGEIVEGKVVARGNSALYLDLGAMGTGIIYGKEFMEAKNKIKNLVVGDSLFAKIVDFEGNEDGYIEMSASSASTELTWSKLAQKKEGEETIMVKILGANKGGLLAEVSGMSAFLPVSQLDGEHYPRVEGGDPQKILRELQKFIGQDLEVKVFDLKPKTGEIILSEKAKGMDKIREALKNYNVGDIVEGEITGLTDFGAFIKLLPAGDVAIEGLIHISELDWKIVEDPSEVVKTGDKVKTKIIDISKDKVSLSLKALKEDPWKGIEEKYKKGDVAEGKVTKFNPFGVFVQITPAIQGLCHVSEFGSQKKMEEKMEIGKSYKFEILLIEPKDHRMSLKPVEEKKE